jgi:Leucine-rich repeat (LRR) protein
MATINTWYGPWNTEDNVVGYAMFYNMPRLRSISLPKDVTKIDTWALGQDRNTNLKLKEIVIPDGVTEIGDHAFYYTGIETLTVPAGVTRLENNTFANCRQLKKATLPDAVTFIGNSCFSECHELTDVNIPAKVETIDDYAFYNNKNRTTPIVLPATLKTIGYRAFMYNSKVTSLTFSEGLETIGGFAFSNLNAVESITLPESIKTINSNAFEGCDSITEFTFPTTLTAVPNSMFYHCDKLAKVTLAAGTTSIEHYAFQDCPKLADINLAEQTALEYVGVYAFANTGFTTVTLPNSIKEMGYSVFRSCKNLTSVNVPTLLTAVPSDFVYDCANLKDVKMHDGIRTISQYAFAGCRSLPTIELNDDITSIEYEAFYNCDSLAITKLPKALITIGAGAFRNTPSLTAELTIPEGVTDLGSDAFNGSGLSKVELPDGLVNFGTTVFANTPNLASVKLPATLTRIPNYTFYRAESLKTIDIPKTLKEVGYAAFGHSGLTTITLPDSLQVIESYAFTYTQLQEFRVPDGLKGDPGSYTWEGCQRLKSIYLGRNQDYSQLSSFTCLHRCDSLQLLRIYAAIPPQCNSYYMGYRTSCVLEVPEDSKQAYMEADVWKEFKDIRGYFDGDVLNDLDFAVMKSLYNRLDGQNWLKPWDLSNNHRSIGKWQGVTTVGDYITAIDLSGQGLQGELTDSLFLLQHLETIDLSNNHIKGDLTTLLSKIAANEQVTEVTLKGNELTGDIYPFLSKLPNITRIDVSYNRLTAMSQPFPNDKLKNDRFYRGFQFISWQTMQPVEDAPVIDVKAGEPVAIESNTLQTYRHEYGDYDFNFNSLARLQSRGGGDWSSTWELSKNGDGLWNLYSGSTNYVLQAKKGEPTVYSHLNPWYSYLTYILRFDWTDGDVNVDQTVDVTDLQSVIYYALNDGKPNSQMFNYTTADANSDNKINVSDVVGSVDYILSYQAPADAPQYAARAPISARNVLTAEGGSVMLTNIDAVAAMQLTISGASVRQLKVSDALRNNFSVKMRDTEDGVRLVIYSADGHTLSTGMHQLLSGLPVGAVVTDARLSDSEAQYLGVAIDGDVTGIDAIDNGQLTIDKDGVYDLQGRRMGNWESLPEGVYIIRANGKQYKVKK